ncbi:facilitated trehalose transporter Tret1-like [Periplaneta americana]|uniref:facilitated trehalose transporter Tret1-like n=1 Tax=Periplaneta americana TaxID=6978 RepID=UPI0037E90243
MNSMKFDEIEPMTSTQEQGEKKIQEATNEILLTDIDQKCNEENYSEDSPQDVVSSPTSRPLLPQVIIVISTCVGAMAFGMSMSHTVILIPHLQEENSTLFVDEQTGSFIASMYSIASPIGYLGGGVFMDIWGRRKGKILGQVGYIFGWATIAGAQNVGMLIIGRTFDGLARGILSATGPVMLDEMTDPRLRGFFSGTVMPCVHIGAVIMMVLGTYLPWRLAASLAPSLNCLVLLVYVFYIPESPSWLVRRRRFDDARRSLRILWGRRREREVSLELRTLTTRLNDEFHHPEPGNGRMNLCKCGYISSTFRSILKPHILKPFLLSQIFLFFQITCGQPFFVFFGIDILMRVKGEADWMDSYKVSIYGNASGLISCILCSFLLLKLGRRFIAVLSGLVTAIHDIVLAGILYKESSLPYSGHSIVWVKIILMQSRMFFYLLGMSTLPFIMLGELLPSRIRGISSGYILAINDLAMGGATMLYPTLMRSLGIQGLYLTFGISCLLCSFFVYLFIPETQGKTLENIEDYFKKTNVMWITRDEHRIDRVNHLHKWCCLKRENKFTAVL